MNLIEYPDLFAKPNESIKSFFTSFPSIHFIDGDEQFMNLKVEDYIFSRYDGHPNEKAHKLMAEITYKLILETSPVYNIEKTRTVGK